MKIPITLIILDGYGLNTATAGNAVAAAETPNLDRLFAKNPHTTLAAAGMDVGLPDGQMGNSEVGHMNIGAGRIVYQELTRITKSIQDGDFFENKALNAAMDQCKSQDSALHLYGLLSDGGVHSHNTHLYALLRMAKDKGLEKVFIHCFLDGRDVSPTSGAGFIEALEEEIRKIGVGKIATVMGRYYVMDRDNRWERVERAYAAMVYGEADAIVPASGGAAAVRASYDAGVTDEFVIPFVLEGAAPIRREDSIISFNFRPDRVRQITRSLVDPAFTGFPRKTEALLPFYVCMTQYDAAMPNVEVAMKPQTLTMTMGEYVSNLDLKQLRIAETEKYAHVTFFYNGGVETVYPGEDRILIPSPKVATYDLQPEMSAPAVTDAVCEAIGKGVYDMIILNFANCDMVGHTGVMSAAVAAVETVDACMGRVVEAIRQIGGIALITADHGNAEKMLEEDGVSPFTAHSTNLVPLIVTGADVKLRPGRLADISPTMLDLMGLSQPPEMDGESLIVR